MQLNVRILLSMFAMFLANTIFAQNDQEVEQYIDKYKKLAIAEQMRSGVPAAITLAQGLHESANGKSELATEANNHFGIKCKSTWTGQTYLHDDDRAQECFRKYSSSEQSYIDHSDFLKNNNRYHFLFDLEVTDYQGWASGLKRAGYATNPAYVKRLTDLIEKYNLQQFTYEGLNKTYETKPAEMVPEKDVEIKKETVKTTTTPIVDKVDETTTVYYKGLKGFYAKKGDMLLQKSIENNIRYARLLQINDLADEPLPFDMFVFTEKKRKVGTVEFHTVQKEENMLMIAQKEAINLDNLYSYNLMRDSDEPAVGEQLNLQYKSVTAPKLKAQFLEPLAVKEEVQKPREVVTEVKKEIAKQKEEIVEIQKPIDSIEEVKKEIPKPVEIKTEEVVIETPKPIEEKIDVLNKEELAKIETLKEEYKKQEPVVEEVKTVTVVDKNSPITDLEKAKKIEEILNAEKKAEKDIVVKTIEEKIEPQKPVEVKQIPVTQAPKRYYNEKNVDDATKDLKRKFDEVIYKPLPPRKVVEKTTTGIVRDTLVTAKKEVKKEMPKPKVENENVKKTTTGIVRDVKKIEADKKETKKKEEPKKETVKSKPVTTKDKKTDDKKEKAKTSVKKEETKKETDKKTKKEDVKKDTKKVQPKDKKEADKKSTKPEPKKTNSKTQKK